MKTTPAVPGHRQGVQMAKVDASLVVAHVIHHRAVWRQPVGCDPDNSVTKSHRANPIINPPDLRVPMTPSAVLGDKALALKVGFG